MMMILILFLMMQNNQVCNDALTGLNNRRRLNRYLESVLPRVSAEHRMFLFIMDINSFKRINDMYGHVERGCGA
jgi:diguanylate cyclase (GGDEF)-like protein